MNILSQNNKIGGIENNLTETDEYPKAEIYKLGRT